MLTVRDASSTYQWLGSLQCSRLENFVFDDSSIGLEDDEVFINVQRFVARHASLVRVDAYLSLDAWKPVSATNPALRHFTRRCEDMQFIHWESAGLGTQPFPRLETLLIVDFYAGMTYDSFEDIVLSRCVHASFPGSRLQSSLNPVKELRVRLPTDELDGFQSQSNWDRGSLFQSASKVVQRDGAWPGYGEVALRWD